MNRNKLYLNSTVLKNKNSRSWFCIILMLGIFILTFGRAIVYNMDKNPGTWAVYAIPHSLSTLKYKHPKKYTSLKSVRDAFVGTINAESTKDNVNVAIKNASRIDKSILGNEIYLWENEDKGIIDFVNFSFELFNVKVESILYFYFFIIFISCAAFSLANLNNRSMLILPTFILAMIYSIIPLASYNPQLTTLIAPRAFPIISIIACLHCILFSLQSRFNKLQVLLLALQISIVIFATHLRVSTYWQLLAIVTAVILGVIAAVFQKNGRSILKFRLAPLVFIILGILILQCYKYVVIPKDYKKEHQLDTRVVWHNIFSGLAFDPELSKIYSLKIDDRSIMDAAGSYLIENNREDEWLNLGVMEAGGRDKCYPLIHWIGYDRVVKEMFIARCKKYPLNCLRNSFFYKPLSHIQYLGWAYGLRELPPNLEVFVSDYAPIGDAVKQQVIDATHKLDSNKLRAYPWNSITILLILLSLYFFSNKIFIFNSRTIISVVILATFSIIPSILGYPSAHTILDSVVAVGILIYLALIQTIHIMPSILLKFATKFKQT